LVDKISKLQEANSETLNLVKDSKYLTLATPMDQAIQSLNQLD
jgi:hypothetical protein